MVTSLFKQERIRTTKSKALAVRRTAEKMITRAKEDTVHNRRIVSGRLYDEGIVAKLFTVIAPRMKDRNGGYTRILKLGERDGDAAEVVILELVDYKLDTGEKAKKSKKGDEKSKGK
jgi:large subunit ribosomal protein L17